MVGILSHLPNPGRHDHKAMFYHMPLSISPSTQHLCKYLQKLVLVEECLQCSYHNSGIAYSALQTGAKAFLLRHFVLLVFITSIAKMIRYLTTRLALLR
jgi:hypothetical protein